MIADEVVRVAVAALVGGLVTNLFNQRTFGAAIAALTGKMEGVETRLVALEKQYVLVPRRRVEDHIHHDGK